jgi:hypothetical protein
LEAILLPPPGLLLSSGDPMPPSIATTAVGILVETKLPGWQIAQYIAHYETRYENTDRGKTTEYTAKNALNTS